MTPIGTSKWRVPAWLGCGAAIVICLFWNPGAIGLVGPDEPRYAWIARAMAESGDWVTPRLYGQPWFEKPILYYWAAGLGFRLHFSAEWAARLPSALAALFAAVAIGWLGWKHYARDVSSFRSPALLAPLLFATSVAAIGFARSASPDMLFSASIALAMASASSVLQRSAALRGVEDDALYSTHEAIPLASFGLFLGLGVLAKGPAAVALAGGAIGLWALLTGKWRAAFRLAHPIAIFVFCIVALPWYVTCAARNADFLRIFIFEHNFERYLTPMFQHRQPFWFFGPIVLLALVPWTPLLWPVAKEGVRLWREKSWRESPGFFVACWAIFPILFFSFSESKLPGYALPAIAPLALLCAIAAIRTLEQNRSTSRLVFVCVGLTWLLLGIAAWRALPRISSEPNGNLHTVGTTALIVGVLIAAALVSLSFFRGARSVVPLCAFFVMATVAVASLSVLPEVEPFFSARSHAAFLHNDQHPDRIFTYNLRRNWNYGLAFYFHREIPEWSPTDPEAALVLTTPNGLAEIKKLGRFRGTLDEPYVGILYVPVQREPR